MEGDCRYNLKSSSFHQLYGLDWPEILSNKKSCCGKGQIPVYEVNSIGYILERVTTLAKTAPNIGCFTVGDDDDNFIAVYPSVGQIPKYEVIRTQT